MKKILSILICVCILAFTFVACGSSNTSEVENESINRFYLVDKFYIDDPTTISGEKIAYVLVDRHTNVCYLHTAVGNRCSMTVMLDADGKPILWEE